MIARLVGIAAALGAAVSTVQSKLATDNLFFYETFDEEDPFSSGKWSKSSDEKYAEQPLMIKTLTNPLEGEWIFPLSFFQRYEEPFQALHRFQL